MYLTQGWSWNFPKHHRDEQDRFEFKEEKNRRWFLNILNSEKIIHSWRESLPNILQYQEQMRVELFSRRIYASGKQESGLNFGKKRWDTSSPASASIPRGKENRHIWGFHEENRSSFQSIKKHQNSIINQQDPLRPNHQDGNQRNHQARDDLLVRNGTVLRRRRNSIKGMASLCIEYACLHPFHVPHPTISWYHCPSPTHFSYQGSQKEWKTNPGQLVNSQVAGWEMQQK